MKRLYFKKVISLTLALALVMSIFSGVFTVSAECQHSYTYTLTKTPTESANGSRHGVCTLCGAEVDEVIEGMLTNISYTPEAGYNYGTTHDVVGAVLADRPAPDAAVDFVEDLGGKEGDAEGNASYNTNVLLKYINQITLQNRHNLQEVVTHIKFGEGDFYFNKLAINIYYDESWVYHGRFTLDGVKGKTRFIADDAGNATSGGLFYCPTNTYSMLYTTFTDIEFTTRTYVETGKPSKTMNYVDGGTKTNSTANLPMNLYQFKAINCVVSGFNSIFTGCTSITGPYISNSDFVDFGDAFFQGCGLVDMKVTNNVIRGYGYETEAGYEPSYFQAQSDYCSGIISNNKLYNMQFDGTNRDGRFAFTGEVVTPFANNYCERVYGVTGVQTVTGNDFVHCSKQDMIDFLETRGEVSQSYLSGVVAVITMPAVANRFSSEDMTGTYLLSSGCTELLDNAYNFGKIAPDHLYYAKSVISNGNDGNIDLSMFPLKYVAPGAFPSGTHLNLNGKSVYSRYRKANSGNPSFNNTSLFDEYGNDIGYIAEEVPAADSWNVKAGGTYTVDADGRLHIKATSALSNTDIASFEINGVDASTYRRYFVDKTKIELLSGDYTKIQYAVTFVNSSGAALSSAIISPENAGDCKCVVTGISGKTEPVMGKMIVTLQITSPKASEETPLELIIPPIEIERYDGMSVGESQVLHTFKTGTDYSVVGADYDELYAAAQEVSGFDTEDVERVYFNETYGHLRTVTINGTEVKSDAYALQTALNDIKDTNKELVIEEGSYNLMYNMTLAKNGIKSGSLYLEGGHTYRIRALGEVRFSFKSDMDSGAFFYQKGEGEVSGYMIGIDTGKPFENVERGAVFHEINFKNFVIDDCTLCGAYSLFYNCTFDQSIYQNGYVAKSNKIFNNSTVTNSCIINNYVHIGWVSAEGTGQENQMDAGWLFYDSAFLNSTFQDNWSEYIRFNNGGWYEKNNYAPSNSLFTGNILDYTVEIKLGYGDIAVGNGNYHCSKWDLMYNDKNVSNMTYDIVNRSVGTYHISSGTTVIGNSFTGTATVSPAIYFDGSTNAANHDGTKAIKNATVFGNNYTYGINKFDEENGMFAVEGEMAETVPSLDVDIETSLYKTLDAAGSTGNYFDFAQVNFHAVPHYWMPGTVVQTGDVMGVLGYNHDSGKVEVLTPSGAATGLQPLSADMLVDFEPLAYYNNGNSAVPEVILKDGDYELKQGVDYAIAASSNNIRTDAILRIEGMGKYYGTIKSYYTISKAPIDLANVKLSFDTAEYDGTDKKPTVVFAYYNHADLAGQYTVSYSDHTALGTSYVTLTANSSSTYFTGSKRIAYTVEGGDVALEPQQTVAPTCEAEGYTTYLCPHCSEVITTDYTAPIGHNMVVSAQKAATCTASGYVRHTCANGCGQTYSETIEATSHVNRFYEIPATCLDSGESGRKCINCGGNKVVSETYEPLGHAATYENVVYGNCQTAGKLQNICSECGDVVSFSTFDIDPNAHDWVVETLKTAPTCTENGFAVATCSVCGAHSENAAIPALGHTAGETMVNGTEKTTTCTVCGKACSKQYHYDWDFTDEQNGADDAKELEELTSISVNSGENYYNSSMGSYLIPYVSAGATNAIIFGTPNGSAPRSFNITTTGDQYSTCVSVPGVIFAHDENGIYTYSVYMSTASSVNEVVYYVPYVKTSGEVTGFDTPWLLMEKQGSLAKVYREENGRLIEVTDIYSVYGFKPGAAEAKYATYDYHLSVSGNTVIIYADIHYSFNLVENADPIKFDLVTETKAFSYDSIKLNAPGYYNTNFHSKTSVTHNEFELAFGVYQYTKNAPNTAYQQGLGEIKGATLNYTVAVDCKHAKTYKTGAIAPTCLKDGKEADTVCADCGAITSAGALIKPLGHDEIVVTDEPTCTELGSATTTCSRCDYYSFVNLPATGHSLSEYEVTTPASCDANGVETAKCSGCGETVNRYIKASGHLYENWQIVTAPTATADGKKQSTCTVCGKVNTKTMLSGQYIEYNWDYNDRVSGRNYFDETAEHSVFVDTSKGTLSDDAHRYYNEKTGTYDIKSASSNTQMTILTPGEGYSASSFEISAYTESFSSYYTTPGVIVAEDANYYYYLQVYFMQQSLYYNVRGVKKSAITATSTEGVYSVLSSNISKLKSAVVIKGAEVNGTKISSENQTSNIVNLIGAENLTQYTTSDGSTVAYALPLTFKYSYAIEGNYKCLDITLEHYNEQAGETTSVKLNRLYITPYAIGLSSSNAITMAFGFLVNASGTPFDCYQTENTGICKINYVNALYTAEEGAHIHSYTAGETAEATCENSGYTLYSCSCGDSYKLAGEMALGHDETVERTEPTCTKAGKLKVTCSRCDYVVDETLSSLGHDYLYNITEATCSKAGRKVTTCSRCTYSRSLVIPKLSHQYETVTIDPTCTEAGSVTTTCTLCGTSTVEETAALGHTESDWIIDKEATATEDGVRHTQCTVCGTVIQTEAIPALGVTLPLGDANGDGVLTVNDAVVIAKYTSNIGELDELGAIVADVDGNGRVDVLDAVLIAKYTTGLIDKFPIEE